MSLEENIDLINWALNEDNQQLDVYRYTIEYYPELSNSSEEEIVSKVVSREYKKNYSQVQSEVKRYNEIWSKYNDDYFLALAEYLNISWPDNHSKIIAKVGLIPVFPRWLEDYSFALTTNLSEEKVLETAVHETCHFLWFKKWSELYPNCPKREYDSPYIPWQYSEMVVDPILNDPKINNIFNNKFIEKAYDSFYELKYQNQYVMEVLKEIYNTKDTIENKIKKGYEYITKALEEIEKSEGKMNNKEQKIYDVTVFGGCSVDQMYYQLEDDTFPNEPDCYVPGGSGSNQAVAASRAGAVVNMISVVGNDKVGQAIINSLNRNGIRTNDIEMLTGIKNDTAKVFVNRLDAENKKERKQEAVNHFTTDMISKYADDILSSKVVITQLKLPKEVYTELIDFCYNNYIPIIVTACSPERLTINNDIDDIIKKISFLACNKEECEAIFNTNDIEKVLAEYPNKLIVTLGKNGLVYHDGNKIVRLPALKIEKVVDTIGAGDTFTGNLATFLANGCSLKTLCLKPNLPLQLN